MSCFSLVLCELPWGFSRSLSRSLFLFQICYWNGLSNKTRNSVMIISFIRLKTIEEFTHDSNPTSTSPLTSPVPLPPASTLTPLNADPLPAESIAQLCLWSGLELDVGVICPCLPSFRLLLRRLWPTVMGTSGRYELDPVSNPTGVTRSGIRRSFAAAAELGGGKIMVENTVAIKYASTDSADGDGRSCASVTGLVEGKVSAEAEAGGRRSR